MRFKPRSENPSFSKVHLIFGLGLIGAIFSSPAQAEKQPGWLWYNESVLKKAPPKKEEKKETQASKTDASKKDPPPQTAAQRLEEVKAELQESLAAAILNPTPANVQRNQQLQARVVAMSEQFSKVWIAQAAMDQPFGTTIQNPRALELTQEKDQLKNLKKIKALSQSFGLYFVFSSHCTFCHEFAATVKAFAQKYGFEVLAISPDGIGIPEFPTPQKDNGILKALNPEGSYPALFLVNPKTKLVVPIARSLLNIDQLEENTAHIIDYMESQNVKN